MADVVTIGLAVAAIGGALAGWTAVGESAIEAKFPPLGEIVTVAGQPLHLTDRGDGPAVILVHGANSNLRDFEASIGPLLVDAGMRVLNVDRPGFGYSPRPDGPWQSPSDLADLLLQLAEERGASQPIMVGHSWAGSVVMAAAVDHPERIRGGVLLAGAVGHWAGSVGATYDWGSKPLIGPVMAWSVVYPYGSRVLPEAVARVLAPDPVPADYVERIGAPLALRPGTFRHNIEDMTRLSEYLQTLSRGYADLAVPLLAIHGTADELVPFWNHGQRLRWAYPALQVKMLDGVGHVPHHARPAEVAQHIAAFAGETRAAAAPTSAK